MLRGEQTELNLPKEGYETASRTVVHSQCLY